MIALVLIIKNFEKLNEDEIQKNEFSYYSILNEKTDKKLKIKIPYCNGTIYHSDAHFIIEGHWILSEKNANLSCSEDSQHKGNIIIIPIKNTPNTSLLISGLEKIHKSNLNYEEYYSRISDSIYYIFSNSGENSFLATYIKPNSKTKEKNLRSVFFYGKINEDFQYSAIVTNASIDVENLKLLSQLIFKNINSLIEE